MAADRPPRFIGFVALVIVLWIVAYWVTPAPRRDGPPIDFQATAQPADGEIAAPSDPPAGINQPAITRPGPDAGAVSIEDAPGGPTLEDVDQPPAPPGGGGAPAVIPPSFREYVSREGDTLQRIARREYGSVAYWRVIGNANPFVDPNRLSPGTRLRIPIDPDNVQGRPAAEGEAVADGPATSDRPEPQYTEYIISRGDTLSGIAKALYGRASLWPRIAEANPGINPDRLRPGDTLRIPPPPAPES